MERIALVAIKSSPDVQPRAALSEPVVSEYAENMSDGVEFPPVVVFYDGEVNWLADGFHRFAAATSAGLDDLPADKRPGSKRDAILHAVGSNATHGSRRTNADKRRSVTLMLDDPEWAKWSDRKIAEQCAVDEKTVARYRPESISGNSEDTHRTVERNGTTYQQDTSNIGRTTKETKALIDPDTGEVLEAEVSPAQPARPETLRITEPSKAQHIRGGCSPEEMRAVDAMLGDITCIREVLEESFAVWTEANRSRVSAALVDVIRLVR